VQAAIIDAVALRVADAPAAAERCVHEGADRQRQAARDLALRLRSRCA
jgi:hypothetical protein